MSKKIFHISLFIYFIYAIDVTTGAQRSVPKFGFNGNTVRGPSWINSEFTDSVATMKPEILRYPGGLGSYWDWNTGWFLDPPTIDTLIIDSLPNNWSSLPYIDIKPIHFQNANNIIDSEGIFVPNMITASLDTMLGWINNTINQGVEINNIELGSEINHDNEYKILKYPTAGDYARDCQRYIDSLNIIIPDADFTLVGGNGDWGNTGRAAHWNDSLYTFVDPESFHALSWHVYLYMKDEHMNYSDRKFISYPFYDVPRIEEWRGFQDTIPQIQNHRINVTEYNLFDKSTNKIYRNTWLHALFLSSMTENILNNNLVNMLLAHNVSGPTGFDAIDTESNFNKKATAFSSMLYNHVSKDMNIAYKLEFPSTFSDTIEYANSNDVIKEINCPRIFGWKFNNNDFETGILTNVTDSVYNINVSNSFNNNLLWTHWEADSLRVPLNGYESIIRTYEIGLTDITIPKFSINTCKSIIIGDVNEDNTLNIVDIVSIVNFIINEGVFTDKQYIISDINLDNEIDIIDVISIVNIIISY